MRSVMPFKRALAGALLALTAAVVVPVGSAAHAAPCTGLCGGGEFHPIATPQRIYDSRPYFGGPINEPSPGPKPISFGTATFDVPVLGQGGIPSSNVLAVAVSITVSEPTSPGVLGAYAAGTQPATLSSLLNFTTGDVVSNMAILSPGAGGKLTVALSGGTGRAQVLIDVFGWFSTSAQPADGSRLLPVGPGRILDTRDDTNLPGRGRRPIGPQESITIPVRGVDAVSPSAPDIVPNSVGVTGVVLNVVGITSSSPTYLSVTPDPLTPGVTPTTSNVTLPPNAVKSNLVIAPVGMDGNVRLFNYSGQTDVAVDVVGYLASGYDPAGSTGRVVPLASPYRTFDTRQVQWGAAPLGPRVAESWSFSEFAGSVNIGGVPVGTQSAVIGNLTNASLDRQYPSVPVASYLTAWPTGAPRPLTSNVNTTSERPVAVPNLALLPYNPTNDTIQVFNYAGKAHYLFDAAAVVLS